MFGLKDQDVGQPKKKQRLITQYTQQQSLDSSVDPLDLPRDPPVAHVAPGQPVDLPVDPPGSQTQEEKLLARAKKSIARRQTSKAKSTKE